MSAPSHESKSDVRHPDNLAPATEMPRPRERCRFVVLWAISERFSRPQLVGAWSQGLHEAMVEAFDERVEEAKEWFLGFDFEDDDPWTFWTTQESIPMPDRPHAEEE